MFVFLCALAMQSAGHGASRVASLSPTVAMALPAVTDLVDRVVGANGDIVTRHCRLHAHADRESARSRIDMCRTSSRSLLARRNCTRHTALCCTGLRSLLSAHSRRILMRPKAKFGPPMLLRATIPTTNAASCSCLSTRSKVCGLLDHQLPLQLTIVQQQKLNWL